MSEHSDKAAERRFLLDAMVLASGLTSKREPLSYSRQLVEMAISGAIRLVMTERVVEETRAVIVNPRYVDHVAEDTADQLLGLLAAAAEVGRMALRIAGVAGTVAVSETPLAPYGPSGNGSSTARTRTLGASRLVGTPRRR